MLQSRYNVEVVLVHAPVVNRKGETIGSAVTNLDLHDIARAGKTYGVETYWVVTPYEEQQTLVREIVGHWRDGYGAKKDTDRAQALSLVQVSPDVENVIEQASQKYGRRPVVLVTGASSVENLVDYQETRQLIEAGVPVLLFLEQLGDWILRLLKWQMGVFRQFEEEPVLTTYQYGLRFRLS